MAKSLSASFSENYTDSISQHSCKLRPLSVTMVIPSSHTEKLLLERSAEIGPRTYSLEICPGEPVAVGCYGAGCLPVNHIPVDMVREKHIFDWSPRRSGGFAITVFLLVY